jgi:hypothetical protein
LKQIFNKQIRHKLSFIKVWMHLKVFLKLKNPKNSLFRVKNPNKPKKPKKNPKNLQKTRVFSNPGQVDPLLIARGLSPVHHFLPDLRGVRDGADDHGGGGGGDDDNCRKNGGDLNDDADNGDGERTVGVRVRRNYIRYRTVHFYVLFFTVDSICILSSDHVWVIFCYFSTDGYGTYSSCAKV